MARAFLPPIVTREFMRATTALHRAGRRVQANKIQAIQIQAALRQPITAAELTNHGETRLPNIEKFNLGDGCRAITQFIEHEGEMVRVFWFAGDHDECESWLERHRGHKYIFDPRDQRIELVPVDVGYRESARLINPELAPALLDQPLLRHLTDKDWGALGVSDVLKSDLLRLTHADYASATVLTVLERAPAALVDVLFDVMSAANEENLDGVRARLDLFHGTRERATAAQVIEAIGLPINADKFLTFADPEEINQLLAREAWEAWMLFVHPAQAEVVEAEFDGPARLRGVSGSGKSSVVLHRARQLARRYAAPILVVTYTSSLARLLQHLLETLCGVEQNLITVSTTAGLAHDVLHRLAPERLRTLRSEPTDQQLRSLRLDALRATGAHRTLTSQGWSQWRAEHDLEDALTVVRERYLECDRQLFVTDTLPDDPLPAGVKTAVVAAAQALDAELAQRRTTDSAGLVLAALDTALASRGEVVDFLHPDTIATPFARCVLVDETQDLSANEMRLLMALTNHTAKDAFFVAADAAQRIFRRNTSLEDLGLDVRGRSYVLRKNYRNTRQILHAARLLLEPYEIFELEDEAKTRIDVDLPGREGALPEIIRFDTSAAETKWVAAEVERIRREEVAILGAGIAILSASRRHREEIEGQLRARRIPTAPLRQDVVASSDQVKISTIESSKGHEFSVVFLIGMNDETIPSERADEAEQIRDARRLYVAMTRARDRVVLTWSRERGARPSRFLTRMMAGCTQHRFDAGRLLDD